MTTNITIYQNSSNYYSVTSGAMYNLLSERVVHMFTRLPTQAGLPGDSTTKLPSVLTVDIGVCTENISLTGIVDTHISVSGNPIKAELESVIRRWWDYGDSGATLPIIQVMSGQAYCGNIKSATFTQEGGTESWWTFELIFNVRAKV